MALFILKRDILAQAVNLITMKQKTILRFPLQLLKHLIYRISIKKASIVVFDSLSTKWC